MSDLIPELRTPTAPEGTGRVQRGMPVSRVDGHAKVTGQAQYAAEIDAPGLRYGVVVSGTIARGRITAIDSAEALAVPGVVAVLTHLNRPKIRSYDLAYKDMTAPAGSPFRPLFSDRVFYSGQPLALVVADNFEAARHAAQLVRVSYEEEAHETNLLASLDQAYKPRALKPGFTPPSSKGDAPKAYQAAPVKIASQFYHGPEHHNPMEMHATTVLYGEDGHLTIYDKTQSSQNNRWYVSRAFGLPKEKVTVRNPYVGGAFGSGLRPQYQLTLAVMAALHLKCPVRVVLTRQQMFSFGHRPETWQKVQLAASEDGKLQAIVHEAIQETSRLEDYVEVVVNWSGQLYACDNIKLGYQLVAHDRHSPIDMRAPGAAHGMHALEVAMDELAYKLRMDPLELRRINYAHRNPLEDKPYSSKELSQCYDKGAQRFGWEGRPIEPRSMRDGDELIGWGMATGMWDSLVMVARVSAVLHADGRLVVSSAASDIGTGTYTVMAMIAAESLGLPMERVTFQLGDSTLPFAPVEGGSSHVTTVGGGVHGACDKLKIRLVRMAQRMPGCPFANLRPKHIAFENGALMIRGRPDTAIPLQAVLASSGVDRVEEKYLMTPQMLKQRKFTRAVHSAVFCEVRVNEKLGIVRVTRVVNAVAAGRIINTKTARSQIVGGVVWGISHALHEESFTDHRFGRFMNHNFAEYHVATNADIHDIEVIFAEEDDRVVSKQLGAKGVGEIGIVSTSAAIANAIFHATGRRIRSTPITPDKILLGDREIPVPGPTES
ncbi:xanthine dehydrogenase family protein molybdopterin-binding subunit [Massilia sp. Dwa41.01b]|uniref:xanthine dehydrogenase family protein molybdopterin-binding subunit n=1 Tax=unclassified Massilia TaxID=2609279 RepID=UPI001604332C|nr:MULTISPECIES: xanthine dehydrogenase family protein molybdopterin-binding subunit [unclassified Massilia]QNA89298.1 xanthine dehydrogenase family protein molybdopterin-binding subunit [Massilia sp. Dwa41.01b]QNB00200.1 xanthine dehydrogenase family protein molybdopterin-binding subunit [Massilia sp. Se16.2.3]